LNTVSTAAIQQYLETAGSQIDKELDRLLPPAEHFPPSIHQAMRYSVFAGGKRLRPILCLEAGRLLGGEEQALVRLGSALAVKFQGTNS
jgi:geranylgeranyl diphosphate synthase type II